MSTEESWQLTPREMVARAKVRAEYMAEWRTEIRNAPHVTRVDKRPWRKKDFLEAAPPPKTAQEELRDKLGLLKAQMELADLRAHPELVPTWARGPYGGPSPKREVANG